MKNKIKILPDGLINQIAAGEVVERPASVVKELVENSLDAGALRVLIEVDEGGKKLIRVIDDGEGMTRDDAVLALERHATSKIQTARDLFAIVSLGFRGEALPSIAAVSRVEVITRTRDMEAGVRIYAEGGAIKDVSEVGAAPGTSIQVKNLFYNVPARRKFLKNLTTELGHISETVSRIAIGRPDVHFELAHRGRLLFRAPANEKIPDRLRHALGASAVADLLPVEKSLPGLLPTGDMSIRGYLSRPSFTRSTTKSLYIFINGRFVKDRIINHAILEAYRTLMPKGRYPVMVIFLEIPAEAVDVNVHPAKSEVRFREPVVVHQAVLDAIIEVLKKDDRTGREYHPPRTKDSEYQSRVQEALERFGKKSLVAKQKRIPAAEPVRISSSEKARAEIESRPEPRQEFIAETKAGFFSGLRVLGQIKGVYLVCESDDEMVIIDQHAAAEKVAFERLKKQYHSRNILRQALLFPQTLELSFRDARTLEANLERLENFGFEIEPFGQNAFILKAVPGLLADADLSQLILDLIEELASLGRTVPLEEKLDHIFAVMSCHAVIRGAILLSPEQIQALLESLDTIEFPSHCPHGRPVINRIPFKELDKMFGK
jgi:DNA mismatch repair protein MutL